MSKTNRIAPTRTTRRSKWKVGPLAVVIAAAFWMVALAPSAGALSAGGTGSSGAADVPKAQAFADYFGATLVSPYRTVTEEPRYRNHDQYVCVTTRLFKLKNGPYRQSWVYEREATNCAWIPAARSSVVVQGQRFTNLLPTQGYRIDVHFSWRLSNGYVLGTSWVDYDRAVDYRCMTPPRCTPLETSVGGAIYMNF